MSKRQRRRYSPEEKAKILRLHLLEQVPISEICEKQGIHPTMFYQWQKALFENAAAALEGQRGTRSTNRQRQAMEAMESKLKRKDGDARSSDLAFGRRTVSGRRAHRARCRLSVL
jgi:transposase